MLKNFQEFLNESEFPKTTASLEKLGKLFQRR